MLCWPECLVPERGMILAEDTTMIPLNCKLRLLPSHSGLLMPLNQQAKKGVTVLAGGHQSWLPEEIGWPLYSEGEEERVWDTGGPLEFLSVITSCLVIKVNGKLQQPNPGRTTNSPDPWGMMAWVTLLGKELRSAQVVAEIKRNTEWIVEEGSYKYQLQALFSFFSYSFIM